MVRAMSRDGGGALGMTDVGGGTDPAEGDRDCGALFAPISSVLPATSCLLQLPSARVSGGGSVWPELCSVASTWGASALGATPGSTRGSTNMRVPALGGASELGAAWAPKPAREATGGTCGVTKRPVTSGTCGVKSRSSPPCCSGAERSRSADAADVRVGVGPVAPMETTRETTTAGCGLAGA
jgi:hypothetical protein